MPPSPSENGGKARRKGRASARPYADTYLVGLRIGLSCEELHRVTYPEILWLVHEYSLMNEAEEGKKGGEEAREATDADVRALMFM